MVIDALLLHLDGFEGPLDLLLELARSQKVDLARISILSLVEQYLAVIEGARRVRLELAADWLVMAAWLTWLKSRLLLPSGSLAADEGEAAAEVLAARLRDLQAIRAAAVWMTARPQLGQDVFARGAPEELTETDRSRLALDVSSLMRAYLAALRRGTRHRQYRPAQVSLWSVKDALSRLATLVGSLPDWAALDQFLPESLAGPLERRAALASTLIAGLEMARGGTVHLRQEEAFGPILVRASEGLPPDETESGPDTEQEVSDV
ncbi:segregation/condensation protein A [Rhodovastum sp. RN2-1]|uniref:Segregation and condensation protein A n=1 Tax=Limobrevibacterium gyesilva TaxID=2991712 RepID=A0AA42CIA7_9PROT|nr:segregation/condensation protein A [Limobrevibacterium gyesilva]